MKKKLSKITIKWIDSWGVYSAWETLEDAEKHNACAIETYGYVVKEDKESIWIVMSIDRTTNMVLGTMVIPKCCIREMKNGKK